MSDPVITVVVVSDFAGGTPGSVDDFRHCLAALAAQDFDEPAEFLLSEWSGYADRIPDDLVRILPSLRIVLSDARSAFDLKNAGARAARAQLVAFLDADCDPVPGWLRAAVDAMRAHPDVAVVNGRTVSPARSRWERIVSLAGRAVGDEGVAGPTIHLALNDAVYRREVILRHPLSSDAGSCGFAYNGQTLRRLGHRLWFEPAMAVTHDQLSAAEVRDVRRLMGAALIRSRQLDPNHRYAWLVRLGYASIPLFVGGKTLLTTQRIITRRGTQSVRWYEVPASVAVAFRRHLMEVPGMIGALRGQRVVGSHFR
jgi:hypothetical protein